MPIGAFKLNTISRLLSTGGTITATGGTITYYRTGGNTYKIHTLSGGTFVVTTGGTANILIAGGGGGGGSGISATAGGGGGGGGGQVIQLTNYNLTPQTYTFTYGTGGSGANGSTVNAAGGTGNSTTAFGQTAVGGGGGGTATSTTGSIIAGGNGGAAGGGGAAYQNPGSFYSGTAGTGTYAGGAASSSPAAAGAGGTNASVGNTGSSATIPTPGISFYGTTYANGGPNSTGSSSSILGSGGSGGSGGGFGAAGKAGGVVVAYPFVGVTSISFVTSATSTTTSIVCPTVQAGDIIVLFNYARSTNSFTPTSVTPTGFTGIGSGASFNATLAVREQPFYKIATGTESGTTLTGMTGTGAQNILLLVYRPNASINQITISTPTAQATDSAPTNQTLSMSSLTGPYIGFAFYSGSNVLTTKGSTIPSTREIDSGNTAVKTFESTSSAVTFSDSTISQSDYGTNVLESFTMTII